MDGRNTMNPGVLTPDEAKLADFLKVREKQVMEDIRRMAEEKSEDGVSWSRAFTSLSRIYGSKSDETFKWYKYFLRQGMIPQPVQMSLLVQLYMDASVDAGFVNTFARVMKNETPQQREDRIREMKQQLAANLDEDGDLCLYRGAFVRAFADREDSSKPIDRAFCFTLDEKTAHQYATIWYPEKAYVYKVKVPCEDVAWYSLYNEEKTVIALPQYKGGGLQVIEERLIPEEEYGPQEEKSAARQAYRRVVG